MEAPGNDVRRSNKHNAADQERICLLLCCKVPKIIGRSSFFGPSSAAVISRGVEDPEQVLLNAGWFPAPGALIQHNANENHKAEF